MSGSLPPERPVTRQSGPAKEASSAQPLRRQRRREFYSIGEVCDMVGLEPHVLRYWETQFASLAPARNRAGNRVYRAADLETIALIHRLVHQERYTIEGARRRLQELEREGTLKASSTQALEHAFVSSLRAELEELLELLEPGSDSR